MKKIEKKDLLIDKKLSASTLIQSFNQESENVIDETQIRLEFLDDILTEIYTNKSINDRYRSDSDNFNYIAHFLSKLIGKITREETLLLFYLVDHPFNSAEDNYDYLVLKQNESKVKIK